MYTTIGLLVLALVVYAILHATHLRPFAESDTIHVRQKIRMWNNGTPYTMLVLEVDSICSELEFFFQVMHEGYVCIDKYDIEEVVKFHERRLPKNYRLAAKRDGTITTLDIENRVTEESVGPLPIKDYNVLYLVKPVEAERRFQPFTPANPVA